jgi:hypothetical protein
MHPDDWWLGRWPTASAPMTRARLAAVLVLALVAFDGASALASPPPAVQQYIESMPTGGGSGPLSSGAEESTLSPALAQKIDTQGGPYTPMLKAIAVSSSAGERRGVEGRLSPTAAPSAHVMAAALDSESAGDRFVVVAIILGVVIASGIAARRWRTSRRARTS